MQAFFANTLNPATSTVVVLGTGGTIAGTAASAQDVLGYTAAQLSVAALLDDVAGLGALAGSVESEQVAQVDSKDMDYAVWQQLAKRVEHHLRRSNVVGVVITHGTDTIEETAFFLQAVLPPSLLANKPVVMTCAMRPATASDADGPQNLQDALRLATGYPMRAGVPGGAKMAGAADPGEGAEAGGAADAPMAAPDTPGLSAVRGVVVVCAGIVHSPRDIQKVHPTRLDPFDSGDAPTLGRISTDGLYTANPSALQAAGLSEGSGWAQQRAVVLPQSGPWPRVEIVLNHAGAGAALVDALMVQNAMSADPIRGLVVAATGNGSIHQALLVALQRAQAQGVRVVRCSRCAFGAVQAVADHPLTDVSALSPVKARIRLMLNLMASSASVTSR